jgi:hypothetical protein
MYSTTQAAPLSYERAARAREAKHRLRGRSLFLPTITCLYQTPPQLSWRSAATALDARAQLSPARSGVAGDTAEFILTAIRNDREAEVVATKPAEAAAIQSSTTAAQHGRRALENQMPKAGVNATRSRVPRSVRIEAARSMTVSWPHASSGRGGSPVAASLTAADSSSIGHSQLAANP